MFETPIVDDAIDDDEVEEVQNNVTPTLGNPKSNCDCKKGRIAKVQAKLTLPMFNFENSKGKNQSTRFTKLKKVNGDVKFQKNLSIQELGNQYTLGGCTFGNAGIRKVLERISYQEVES